MGAGGNSITYREKESGLISARNELRGNYFPAMQRHPVQLHAQLCNKLPQVLGGPARQLAGCLLEVFLNID